MASIAKFEDIVAWQKARELSRFLGELINDGKFEKNYRLRGQMEGSMGSIMDNIAEGFERGGNKEFVQFLSFSKGSCGELKSQLYRALDRKYLSTQEFDNLYERTSHIAAMLQKLINYLLSSDKKGAKYTETESRQASKKTKL